jgi:hypothetical protein
MGSMHGFTAAFVVLLLQRWWAVRTSNSPRIRRSFPYPRQLKACHRMYAKPARLSRGQRLVVTTLTRRRRTLSALAGRTRGVG